MHSTGGMCWHVKFNRVWSSGSLGGRHQDLSHCLKTCIRVWCSSLGSPKKAVRSSQLPHVAMILHPIAVTIFTYLHYSLFQVVEHSKFSLRKRQRDFCQRRSQAPPTQAPATTSSGTRHCNAVLGLMDSLLESRWMNRPGRRRNVAAWIHPRSVFFLLGVRMSRRFMKWNEMNC